MPYPDRFYPVVDSVKWVTRLTALGVGTIQLRAKDLNDSEALQKAFALLDPAQRTTARKLLEDRGITPPGGTKPRKETSDDGTPLKP